MGNLKLGGYSKRGHREPGDVERAGCPKDGATSGDGSNDGRAGRSGLGAEGRGRLVVVLGGTGFLGRRVVRHLLDRGFRVRAAARHPERVPPLFGPNEVGVEAVVPMCTTRHRSLRRWPTPTRLSTPSASMSSVVATRPSALSTSRRRRASPGWRAKPG